MKKLLLLTLILSGGNFLFYAIEPKMFEVEAQYQSRPREGWPEERGGYSGQPDVDSSQEERYSPYALANEHLACIKKKTDEAYKEYLGYQRRNDLYGASNAREIYLKYKQALDEKLRRCRDIPNETGCTGPPPRCE